MIEGDWKKFFRRMFSFSENNYVELDDRDIRNYSPEFLHIGFDEWLTKNGFTKESIFSQICVYYNHIFDIVFTSEYSDNTGYEYWRYFDSAKEYNEHVSIETEGLR